MFVKHKKLVRRAAKIAALDALATPEARKQRKQMNDVIVKRERQNLNGFFGSQIVRGKEKRKTRRRKTSPQLINLYKKGY